MKTKGQRQSTNIIDTRHSKSLKKRLEVQNKKILDGVEREAKMTSNSRLRDKTPISKQKPTPNDNANFNINLEFVPPTEMIKGRSPDTKPTKFSKSKGKETDFFHMDSKDNLKGPRKGK